jgi:hypothetical protein
MTLNRDALCAVIDQYTDEEYTRHAAQQAIIQEAINTAYEAGRKEGYLHGLLTAATVVTLWGVIILVWHFL